MPDAFDVLRSADRRVEPDAPFRARLVDEMDRVFDAASAAATAPSASSPVATPGSVAMTESSPVEHPSHRRPVRMFTLLVAAAAVTALIAAVIVARSREATAPSVDIQAPAPAATISVTSPSSTPAPTTASTATTTNVTTTTTLPFDSVAAKAVGDAILLDSAEYAPNVTQMDFKDVVLDRSIAADVPGCASFLDTVFEGPDRPAATTWTTFYSSLPALLYEYVVVFPTEEAAQAMFDATVDPAFSDGCFQPYLDELTLRYGVECCDPDVAGPPALGGEPIDSPETFGADDVQLRRSIGQSYTYLDQEHGPESFEQATLRVGRVIVVIEAITQDEFGDPVISEDQFHSAVATAVTKARAALEGSSD